MRTIEQLRPVQRRLIREMVDSSAVVAVLGMGGGKTVCALTAAKQLIDEGQIRAAIVIAPKRVAITTWPQETRRWEHLVDLSVGVLSGTPARREAVLRERHDIYTCGMDNLPWLIEQLKALPDHPGADQLIIDELSRYKGPRGSRAKLLNRNAEMFQSIWGLTGTPRPNGWEDLWMPLQIVSKGYAWGQTFDRWRERFFEATDYMRRNWVVRAEALPVFRRVVDAWCVTIPPEFVVDVPFVCGPDHDIVVDLCKNALDDIDRMSRELMVEVGAPTGLSLSDLLRRAEEEDAPEWVERTIVAMSEAVASGKISQILQGYVYREGVTTKRYAPAKADALVDFVEALDGEPLIICYWYQEDLEVLRALYPGIAHLGAGVSDRRAGEVIEAWNAGQLPLLALHPASAGHGLNLQFGGARMLWYAMPWSAEMYIQTIKRLARPGQTRPVFVHRLLADHPYERLRLARVENKIDAEADFISDIRSI